MQSNDMEANCKDEENTEEDTEQWDFILGNCRLQVGILGEYSVEKV